MLFAVHEQPEDHIIRLLLNKSQTVKSIKKALSHQGISMTVQGIYRILRNLLTEDIVIKQAFEYSLNEDWRRNIVSYFSQAPNPIVLSEGDSVRMNFHSLVTLALQWKNIVLPLQDMYAPCPVFDYNPHYIWAYLGERRKQSEAFYYQWFEKNHTFFFLVIGNKTSHDETTAQYMRDHSAIVVTGKPLFPSTIYKLIIADYVITTRITGKLAVEIERLYKKSKNQQELERAISKLTHTKHAMSITVERNKEKAKKLRKKIAKHFDISKDLKEQFDLF